MENNWNAFSLCISQFVNFVVWTSQINYNVNMLISLAQHSDGQRYPAYPSKW